MVRKILLVFALVLVMLWLVGCHTVQGIGGDIAWTGKAGQDFLDGLLYPPTGIPE